MTWTKVQGPVVDNRPGVYPSNINAFVSNVTAGNLLVAAIWLQDVTGTVSTMTDSQGNTWIRAGGGYTDAGEKLDLWYTIAGSSAACTTTMTPSLSMVKTTVIVEYNESGGIPTLDFCTGVSGSSTNPSGTAASAGSLGLGMQVDNGGNPTFTGYTNISTPNTGWYETLAHNLSVSSGAVSLVSTLSGAKIFAVFKPAAGGAGTTYNVSISESITATDAMGSQAVFNSSISESITATDTDTAAGSVYNKTISESVTATDTTTGAGSTFNVTISESVTATDATNASAGNIYSVSISESITATDSIGSSATFNSTITESITATDSDTATGPWRVSITETLTATDSIAVTGGSSVNDGLDPANSLGVVGSADVITRFYCQVCEDRVHRHQLKKRWDGVYCCPQCWEARHPLDFYRPRVDVHPVELVVPASDELTFTPTVSAGITGTYTPWATYSTDSFTTVRVNFTPPSTGSVAITANSTIDTPTSVSVAGSGTVINSRTGRLLSLVTITVAGKITILTAIPSTTDTLIVRGRYTH